MKRVCFLILFTAVTTGMALAQENCEGETQNGKAEGHWKCYYEDGTLSSEGDYAAGMKIGEWKYFHANGAVALAGQYEGDLERGRWMVFDDSGNKIDEIDYGQ